MDVGFTFGRFLAGALISAALAVGGVWFVVDMSLRGMETAVEATNDRIGDVQSNLQQLRSEFTAFRADVKNEFDATRDAITRTTLRETERVIDTPDGRFVLTGPGGNVDATVAQIVKRYGAGDATMTKLTGLPLYVPRSPDDTSVGWATVGTGDGSEAILITPGENGLEAVTCARRTANEDGTTSLSAVEGNAVALADGIVCRSPGQPVAGQDE